MAGVTSIIADGVAAREAVVDAVGEASAGIDVETILDEATSGKDVVSMLLHAALALGAAHMDDGLRGARASVAAEVAVVRASDPRTLVRVTAANIAEAKERRRG